MSLWQRFRAWNNQRRERSRERWAEIDRQIAWEETCPQYCDGGQIHYPDPFSMSGVITEPCEWEGHRTGPPEGWQPAEKAAA